MFVCIANSCRSQMAEGLAREIGRGLVEPYSSGLIAAGVHPLAIEVMKEIGIDISGQRSKEIDRETTLKMDIIVTLCTEADNRCPVTPWTIRKLSWPIIDPVGARGSKAMVLNEFRRARDEIRAHIVRFLDEMKVKS
jgi:arsenate reductase (thioredoxin)